MRQKLRFALLFVLLSPLSAHYVIAQGEATIPIYQSELNALYLTLNRYEATTESLTRDIETSKIQLTQLGENVTRLENLTTTLQAESNALKIARDNLEKSIEISAQSWTEYADELKAEMRKARIEIWIWRAATVLCFVCAIAAAGN